MMLAQEGRRHCVDDRTALVVVMRVRNLFEEFLSQFDQLWFRSS